VLFSASFTLSSIEAELAKSSPNPKKAAEVRRREVTQMESRSNRFSPLAGLRAHKDLQVALLTGLAAVSVNVPARAQGSELGPPLSLNSFGVLESTSTSRFNTGTTNGFFAQLGTNGRTCATCHVEADAWALTPRHARLLPHDDPLFAPVDGADCPPTSSHQGPNRANSSMMLEYAVLRVQLAIPATANFSLASTTNP